MAVSAYRGEGSRMLNGCSVHGKLGGNQASTGSGTTRLRVGAMARLGWGGTWQDREVQGGCWA